MNKHNPRQLWPTLWPMSWHLLKAENVKEIARALRFSLVN